jgi:hypothetical protein
LIRSQERRPKAQGTQKDRQAKTAIQPRQPPTNPYRDLNPPLPRHPPSSAKLSDTGVRKTRPFEANQEGAEIKPGEFFILGGQKPYVAEVGAEFLTEQGRKNARMRVIFDNGTEIRGLLRSFQRALYKDEAGRWVTSPSAGPLFDQSDAVEGDDTGTIYVLRSKSTYQQSSRIPTHPLRRFRTLNHRKIVAFA